MKYTVKKGIIQGKKIGETIEMPFDMAKKYGPRFLEIDTKNINETIETPPVDNKPKTWDEIKAEAGDKVDKLSAEVIRKVATDSKIDILKEDGKNIKSKKTLIEELNNL